MAAPTNLTATAIDDDSISLSWDAYAGASGYDIERDGSVIVTNHATTSYTDTGLDPGTSYDYRVRAKLGAAVAFNPETDITWHSLFWAEGTAFTALGLSDAASVSTWPNETGESDATQDTALRQPAYMASTTNLNNKPSVDFDVSDEYMQTGTFTSAITTRPWSLITVVDLVSEGGYSRCMFDGVTGDAARMFISTNTTGSMGGIGTTTGTGALPFTTGGKLWYCTWNTGNDISVLNNNVVVNAAVGDYTLADLCLNGRRTGVTNAWGVRMAFVGLYEGDISQDANFPAFVSWVNEHYGLPVSPYLNGGTVTVPGDGYVYHTFTTSGELAPIGDPVEVEYLVVAGGGGGGGGSTARSSGGGGAGGLLQGTATVASSQTVTIGGGGAGGATSVNGTSGSNSVLGAITATGGGGGGAFNTAGLTGGLDGGSGGGGGAGSTGSRPGGSGTTGQGSAGGDGTADGSSGGRGGGGGGAGGAGADGAANDNTETSGSGLSVFGATYATGGNGGMTGNAAASPNTGDGGDGVLGATGFNAGSGITIVRYPIDYAWSGAITDPSDLIGLEHWIDPSDASTLTKSGDAVTALTDKSPNAYSATITGTLLHNSTAKGVINGLAAFQAEQTSELFTVPISGVTTDVTVFAVVKPHISTGQLFDIRDASDAVPLHDDGATGGRRGRRRNNANTLVSTTGTGTFTFDTPHIYTYAAHSTLIQFWMNGANGDTSSIAVSGTMNGLDKVDYLRQCNGGFGEFVIYRRFMEAAERLLVEQYLASKWGVTLA